MKKLYEYRCIADDGVSTRSVVLTDCPYARRVSRPMPLVTCFLDRSSRDGYRLYRILHTFEVAIMLICISGGEIVRYSALSALSRLFL